METLKYKDFVYLVGKTIEHCQTIEHDIKWLYALMKPGNPIDNMNEIATWTLGNTVFELETLDNTSNKKTLGKKEYSLLKNITGQRNYICHEIYRDFLYVSNFIESIEYQTACKKLYDFYNKIEKLQKQIEDFRIEYGSKRK